MIIFKYIWLLKYSSI